MSDHPLRVVRMTHEDAQKRGKHLDNNYLLSLAVHFRMGALFNTGTIRHFEQEEDGELMDLTLDVRGMHDGKA